MGYSDMLVHVDNSRSCAARLEVASALAATFDAHLIGVNVTRPAMIVPAYAEAQIPAEIVEAQAKYARARADEAAKAFESATKAGGVRSEWRAIEGDLANSLVTHSRYVDLVILGQHDPDDQEDISAGLAGQVVLESGRPVLVMPYIGARNGIGKHVMVAWNASRESVRAVNDALPLLRKAEKVEVLAVNPPAGARGEGDIPSADICLHLARHDVKAEAQHLEARDIDVGDMVLSRVADEGIDLVVMGGYGRSRLRELILGGATRELLDHMTVPVLMSH